MAIATEEHIASDAELKALLQTLAATPPPPGRGAYTAHRVKMRANEIRAALDAGWSVSAVAKRLADGGFGRTADAIRREIARQMRETKTEPRAPRAGQNLRATKATTFGAPEGQKTPQPSTPMVHAGLRDEPV